MPEIKQYTDLETVEEQNHNPSAVLIARVKRAFTAAHARQVVIVSLGNCVLFSPFQ
jgi:hypothetical protein